MASANRWWRTTPLAALALVLAAAGGCRESEGGIVAGTAHIEEIVRALEGPGTVTGTLIAPAMCPGHSDLRPSDVERLRTCDAVLLQPWQRGLPNISGAIEASGVPETRMRSIDVPGNWMVPGVRAKAIEAVAQVLGDLEGHDPAVIASKAQAQVKRVLKMGEALQASLAEAGVPAIKVLCNDMQQPFVEWCGFETIATFGRPEDMSVAEIERLLAEAKAKGAALIIDNLQSGDLRSSETLSRDAGAVHVVLSNFPGAFEGTATWEEAAKENVKRLLEAIETWRGLHE